jgi:hypothetical protein
MIDMMHYTGRSAWMLEIWILITALTFYIVFLIFYGIFGSILWDNI